MSIIETKWNEKKNKAKKQFCCRMLLLLFVVQFLIIIWLRCYDSIGKGNNKPKQQQQKCVFHFQN